MRYEILIIILLSADWRFAASLRDDDLPEWNASRHWSSAVKIRGNGSRVDDLDRRHFRPRVQSDSTFGDRPCYVSLQQCRSGVASGECTSGITFYKRSYVIQASLSIDKVTLMIHDYRPNVRSVDQRGERENCLSCSLASLFARQVNSHRVWVSRWILAWVNNYFTHTHTHTGIVAFLSSWLLEKRSFLRKEALLTLNYLITYHQAERSGASKLELIRMNCNFSCCQCMIS